MVPGCWDIYFELVCLSRPRKYFYCGELHRRRVSSEQRSAWLDIQRLSGGLRAFSDARRMARRPAGPAAGAHGGGFFVGGFFLAAPPPFLKKNPFPTFFFCRVVFFLSPRSDYLFRFP